MTSSFSIRMSKFLSFSADPAPALSLCPWSVSFQLTFITNESLLILSLSDKWILIPRSAAVFWREIEGYRSVW